MDMNDNLSPREALLADLPVGSDVRLYQHDSGLTAASTVRLDGRTFWHRATREWGDAQSAIEALRAMLVADGLILTLGL